MKPVDVKSNNYIDSSKELIIKVLDLKLLILLEYENIKMSLQKVLLLLMIITRKKLLELFYEKELQKQIKKSLELRK